MSNNQTYYNPQTLSAIGGSEHAMRMPRVALFQTEDGFSPFNALTRSEKSDTKRKAISILFNKLNSVSEIEDDKLKNDVYWEFFLANKIRFEHLAIFDSQDVSRDMRKLIIKLFIATRKTIDEGIHTEQKSAVQSLASIAWRDKYDWVKPESRSSIPTKRALVLLKSILANDRDLERAIWQAEVRQKLSLSLEH